MAVLCLNLAVAAAFRDQVIVKTGGNVPVDFYFAVDLADAEYVTFYSPSLLTGCGSIPCSPIRPIQMVVL